MQASHPNTCQMKALYRKFARFVLFCPIKKCSFNLLCVLDLFCIHAGPSLNLLLKILFFYLPTEIDTYLVVQ